MNKEILNNENKETAEKLFEQIIKLGVNFKLEDEVTKRKVDFSKIQGELCDLPIKGENMEKILKIIENKILPYCTNFSSTKFMGFPDAGNSIAGITGAVLTDFLQQNLINSSFCAPMGTYLEIAVIQWLRTIVGYESNPNIKDIWNVGGIITYRRNRKQFNSYVISKGESHKKYNEERS